MNTPRKMLPSKKQPVILPTKPANAIATTTVHQLRTLVFSHKMHLDVDEYAMPKRQIIRENKYGIVTFLSGGLSETSCRIVSILLSNMNRYNTEITMYKEKEFRTCEFTAHMLLKDLGCGNKPREWVYKELLILKASIFRIHAKKGFFDNNYSGCSMSVFSRLLDDLSDSHTAESFKVYFDPDFIDLWKRDINMYIDKATKVILDLDQAWVRTIVRLITSHDVYNETLHETFFNAGITCEKHAERLHPEINKKHLQTMSVQKYNEYRRIFTMKETIECLANLYGPEKGIRISWSDPKEDFVVHFVARDDGKGVIRSQKPIQIERDSFKVEINEKVFSSNLETELAAAIAEHDAVKERIEAKMKKEKRLRISSTEDEELDALAKKAEQLLFKVEKEKVYKKNQELIKSGYTDKQPEVKKPLKVEGVTRKVQTHHLTP